MVVRGRNARAGVPQVQKVDNSGRASLLDIVTQEARDVCISQRLQDRAVRGQLKHELIRERALVEGSIGTIKRQRYGFNRPAAQSLAMMGVCGQRAVLGFNLGKLVRGIGHKRRLEVVW